MSKVWQVVRRNLSGQHDEKNVQSVQRDFLYISCLLRYYVTLNNHEISSLFIPVNNVVTRPYSEGNPPKCRRDVSTHERAGHACYFCSNATNVACSHNVPFSCYWGINIIFFYGLVVEETTTEEKALDFHSSALKVVPITKIFYVFYELLRGIQIVF